jgi:hypothetical protein
MYTKQGHANHFDPPSATQIANNFEDVSILLQQSQ